MTVGEDETAHSDALTVDEGLPATRADWPEGVLDAAARFSMGDVIEDPPFFYFADPGLAVWHPTKDYASNSSGPEIIDASNYAPRFGMLVSQTCDIGEIDSEPPGRPWVQVAPVYDFSTLDGSTKKLLRQGKGPLHLLHLPALDAIHPGFWAADLRIEFPIEKSLLTGRLPIAGFATESAQREVGRRLAYLRGRPAWATEVVVGVQRRLIAELRNLKAAEPAVFEELLMVSDSVGARTDDMLNPRTLQLCLFVTARLSNGAFNWWQDFCDSLRDEPQLGNLTQQAALLLDCQDCSISRWREFEPVPLTRFSPV